MMIISIAAKVVSVVLIAGGPRVPDLDMKDTCQNIVENTDSKICLDEEKYALRKLKKYWHQIPNAYKIRCIADPSTPDRTYGFLRDCINNEIMLQKEKKSRQISERG